MYHKTNKYWRIFSTGLCFSFFGFGGLFLSLLVFPLQRLLIQDIEKRKNLARKTVHYSFKFFIKLMAYTGTFSFHISQAKELKHLNGHIIMANHPSLIDVVVLISIIPNANCVVKTHLFKNVFMKGVLKNTGYISNDDPEGLLIDCKATLEQGNNLIIFPQGTRTTPGEEATFQRGAANIAIRCQAKVSTVLIKVEPTTLTKSEMWYQIPDKKPCFSTILVENTLTLPENSATQISKNVREYNRNLECFFKEELLKYE